MSRTREYPIAEDRTGPESSPRQSRAGRGDLRSIIRGATLRATRCAADAALAVLLAPPCAACQLLLDSPTRGCVCDTCWSSVSLITPPVCDRCGDPLPTADLAAAPAFCTRCRRMPRAIDRGRAAGHYEGSLRAIVHAFKYDGRRSLAVPLAALMRRQAGDLLDAVDWIVPVPLHWRRERERGFNQAGDLARALVNGHALVRGRGRVLHALRRVRPTTTQAELPAARRHRNVRGAFELSRGFALAGSCVLLVDDVSTTGATIESCARVLKDAGVREIRAITAARVVTRPSR